MSKGKEEVIKKSKEGGNDNLTFNFDIDDWLPKNGVKIYFGSFPITEEYNKLIEDEVNSTKKNESDPKDIREIESTLNENFQQDVNYGEQQQQQHPPQQQQQPMYPPPGFYQGPIFYPPPPPPEYYQQQIPHDQSMGYPQHAPMYYQPMYQEGMYHHPQFYGPPIPQVFEQQQQQQHQGQQQQGQQQQGQQQQGQQQQGDPKNWDGGVDPRRGSSFKKENSVPEKPPEESKKDQKDQESK